MCYCYILFSEKLDRYYIGSTILQPEERLKAHLSEYYGNSKYTAKAKDWTLFYSIACCCIEQAKKVENHIKRMRNKKYIQNLPLHPDIAEKLLSKYS